MDSVILPTLKDCTCIANQPYFKKDPECPYHKLYGWGLKSVVNTKEEK